MVTPERTLAFLRKKWQREREENFALWQKASRDAEAIIAMIINTYQPKSIYQWGSLLDSAKFRSYSDIDIALEGIPDGATFFDLYGRAMRMTDFPLDIVELDKIEPIFAAHIRKYGKCVYAQ